MRPEVQTALETLRKGEGSVEEALALLQNTVFNFSMKVCGHREDAEDTMQDVLLKFLPFLSKFDNAQALAVWLYKVARNNCLTKRRRGKSQPREHLSLDELMPSGDELAALSAGPDATPEALALRGERADLLREAIVRVPPQYRLILVLHDMEGLSMEEVSRISGLREGTVRVRLHRARLFVRRELAKGRQKGMVRRAHLAQKKPRSCRELFAALSDYMDGALDGDMCEELERHLQGCTPCENFLASLEQIVRECGSLQPDCTPQNTNKVREKLMREYRVVLENLRVRQTTAR